MSTLKDRCESMVAQMQKKSSRFCCKSAEKFVTVIESKMLVSVIHLQLLSDRDNQTHYLVHQGLPQYTVSLSITSIKADIFHSVIIWKRHSTRYFAVLQLRMSEKFISISTFRCGNGQWGILDYVDLPPKFTATCCSSRSSALTLRLQICSWDGHINDYQNTDIDVCWDRKLPNPEWTDGALLLCKTRVSPKHFLTVWMIVWLCLGRVWHLLSAKCCCKAGLGLSRTLFL